METLDLDGASLAHRFEGAGAHALAFFHGWCSKSEHWDAQAVRFAPTHRIIRWDRRGLGRSRADEPGSTRRHAADLVALLDRAQVDRAVVIGHAGGGPASLRFAVEHADRTAALVLVDSRLHRPPAHGVDPLATWVDATCDELLGPDGDAAFERLYRSFFGPRAAPALVDDAVATALGAPRAFATADLRAVLEDTKGLAGQVNCPVLHVSAQPADTAMVNDVFAATTPWVGHVVGAGHFLQLEVPDQLNAMIDTFLTAHDLNG